MPSEQEFLAIVEQWRNATRHHSMPDQFKRHPNYEIIMAFGPEILPMVFKCIPKHPHHMFLIINEMLDDGPDIPEAECGILHKMITHYMAWGRSKGYLPNA